MHTKFLKISTFWRFLALHCEPGMNGVIFTCDTWELLETFRSHPVLDKMINIVGFLRKFWVRNLCFYARTLIRNLILFYLALTWPPSKVMFDKVIRSNYHHYWYGCMCHCLPIFQNEPQNMSRTVYVRLLLVVTFWDLTSTMKFLRMTLVLM